ncbi:hypothetical protein ACR79S_01510 [Sphingobacterium spiritivorum]|uniref:hypothetical protein n=1 Tax=Sphingobacterium spiritivorum TaxID=258 RepID=UPI003DA34CB5
MRETNLTGPWMLHGNFPTLRDVVELYNPGNPAPIRRRVIVDEKTRPVPSPLLRKLNLTKTEADELISFLQAISSSTQRRVTMPEFPE